ASLVRQAAAQYKWHRHTPLIKFLGPRKALWAKQQEAAPAAGNVQEAINFWELPARYRPSPLTELEIEAIESGGASLM
ncbi:hypothetical protein EC988_007282, partial [Linderina pennispora]